MSNAEKVTTGLRLFSSHLDASKGADAIVLATDWDVYKATDMEEVKKHMAEAMLFDGRNAFDPVEMQRRGWEYYSIGRAGQSFAISVS